MRKYVYFLILFLLTFSQLHAQDFGLSFSYFIPKNGYFSIPVTPFSFRGVGFDFNRFSGIETGFSLYRMSGMGVKDLPFESKKPLIGPFFSLFVPLDLVLKLSFENQVFKLKGGGFGFYDFATKINYGNLDRELKDYLDWRVLNSDFSINNNLGYGYHVGAEYIIYFSKKFGLTLEAYYLSGSSPLDMKGTYEGIPHNGDPLQNESVDYPDAKLDFTGYEFSVGVILSP